MPLVFWSFRVMVGIGTLDDRARRMVSLWLRWRGRLYDTPWFLRWALAMGAVRPGRRDRGWITTEAGRQPFTVYGLMRTADSVSPIAAPAVATSLAMFVVVYFVVFGAGIWYLFRLFGHPPRGARGGAARRRGDPHARASRRRPPSRRSAMRDARPAE